ncbi:MAG TPA: cytochrome c [Methylomirabilota bacterium]|nr:cytochrome c [Methylomirabilota bacterium]
MTSAGRLTGCASALLLCLLAGCRQDMADQPKHRPLSPSAFFGDGRSERDPVDNTVARGALVEDELTIPKDSNNFPLPVTRELLERGRERFGVFCTPCHGLQGDGNGMAAVRGMKHPPSYHDERLRQAPVGHFYDVITHGFGAMYDYSAQIAPRDRWAIIAYVRALQLSRHAPASELPEELRRKLEAAAPASAPAGEEKK